MNKRLITALFISFIMFFSVFFINIDKTKADVNFETLDGYAQCQYEGHTTENADTYPTTDFFEIDIYVYKEKDGTKVGWGKLKTAENVVDDPYTEQRVALKETDIYNYNDIFHHADTQLFPHFYVNGQYTCIKNVYIHPGGILSITPPNSEQLQKGPFIPLTLNSENSKIMNEKGATGQAVDRGVNETISDNAVKEFEQEKNGDKERIDYKISSPSDAIKLWGDNAEEGEYSPEDVGTQCSAISDIGVFLNNLLWIIDIIAIILLIIMTMADFVKAIVGSEDDTLKKSFKNLVTRAIVVVILLLLPVILGSIISMFNKESGTVQIGEDGKPFCNVGTAE